MKKRVLIIFLLILLLCGCSKKNEKNTKKYDEILKEYSLGYGGVETINCDEINDAISVEDNYFILNDGKVYLYSVTNPVSKKKNCKKVNKVKNAKYTYRDYIFDQDHNVIAKYNYTDKNIITDMDEIKENSYVIKDSNKKEHIDDGLYRLKLDFDYVSDSICSDNIFYTKDNKVYAYNYKESILLGEIPSDEKILYIAGTLVKTNKNYYKVIKLNEEECNKFVDVKCTYDYVKSSLSDVYDKIYYASEEYVIDDNGNIYGNNTCFNID